METDSIIRLSIAIVSGYVTLILIILIFKSRNKKQDDKKQDDKNQKV